MGIYLSYTHLQNISHSKKAMRIITHSPFQCNSSPLIRNTNNLNIFQIIEYYAYISLSQKLSRTVHNVFRRNRFLSYSHHTYEARNNLSIIAPLPKRRISMKSIYHNGIKIWNNLSPEIRPITTNSKFRKIIRKMLINDYIAMAKYSEGCFPLIA